MTRWVERAAATILLDTIQRTMGTNMKEWPGPNEAPDLDAPPKRRASPEAAIQVRVMKLLRERAYPNVFYFAIPNGGLRSITEAGRFRAQGVTAGVPDICIIKDGKVGFLELKAPKGKLSSAQKAVMLKLRAAGAVCETAYGFDEAKNILTLWLVIRPDLALGIPL
jgi:hypothetical protein